MHIIIVRVHLSHGQFNLKSRSSTDSSSSSVLREMPNQVMPGQL